MAIQSLYPTIKPSLNLDFAATKQLDPRITFTRTTTATYYDGKTVAKAEENLITNSNAISTANGWVQSGITITANNATAPDGTTTASLLTADTAADVRIRFTTTQANNTTYTFSVYAKAGTGSWLRLRNTHTNPDANAWFDLTNGVVGTASNCTSTIVSVGSGWYRCTMTASVVTGDANFVDIGNTNADNVQTGTSGQTIYVWGVQLEARSSATALTVTATQPITNYIPVLQTAAAGQARFDHNPITGESLGLLIEEQRTNLLQRSEEFDNAYWTKTNATITANAVVAPDGTLTADKLIATTATAVHDVRRNFGAISGKLMVSCYAKIGELSVLQFTSYGDPFDFANFNLSDGTVSARGSSTLASNCGIINVGNGWYRCWAYIAPSGDGLIAITVVNSPTAGWAAGFTGNGFNGLYIWGSQSEAGAFPTSYIKTVAATATRNADAASMTGTNFSSWYNQSEGTIYSEFTLVAFASSGNRVFGIQDNPESGNNTMAMYQLSATNIGVFSSSNGSAQFSQNLTPITINVPMKGVFSYATNNAAQAYNGLVGGTDTTYIAPSNPVVMVIGSNLQSRTIKKLAYYPSRLSNANLQALTA